MCTFQKSLPLSYQVQEPVLQLEEKLKMMMPSTNDNG
jgi:hypothetical protein